MAIRILHVIPSLGRGGAERQLVGLVSNTSRPEYEHVVCHLQPPDSFAADIRRAGHAAIGLNLRGKRPLLAAASRLVQLLRSQRPDIVHTWLYDANVSARLARSATGRIPMITSLQSTDYEPDTIRAANLSRVKVGALRLLDKASAGYAAPLFVACSHSVEQSARQRLGIPQSRIRVIYNSVDPDTLLCEPEEPGRLRRSLEIPADALVYLNVGRLDPQKGQSCLLRAFQKVATAEPRAYLVMVGDGPLASELRQLATELGIIRQVRFTGRRNDIGACLEMADVFVFPSRFEGLSLALAEAMFKGLPCIASRIAPHLEIIVDESAGILITPDSADELAAAMVRLRDDPAYREQLGRRGRESALPRFHSKATTPQWESLYREVAQKAGRARL